MLSASARSSSHSPAAPPRRDVTHVYATSSSSSSEPLRGAHERSATGASPEVCSCATTAAQLHSEGRHGECIQWVTRFMAELSSREGGRQRHRHHPGGEGAQGNERKKLQQQPSVSAFAGSLVPPSPPHFSHVSAMLHSAFLSLLELRQLAVASELLQLWDAYKAAACESEETEERRMLWCGVLCVDTVVLARTAVTATDASRDLLPEAVDMFGTLVEGAKAKEKRKERIQALSSLSLGCSSLNNRTTTAPSDAGKGSAAVGVGKMDEETTLLVVQHAVRLAYLVLHDPRPLWSSETARAIFLWLRARLQPPHADAHAGDGASAFTPPLETSWWWCLWQLCEARLSHLDGKPFGDIMAILSEATKATQAHLRHFPRRPSQRPPLTSEPFLPSSSSSCPGASPPSVADRFAISSLVASIVKKYAAKADKENVACFPTTTTNNNVENALGSSSRRLLLLRNAVQLAVASFLANVQESLRDGGGYASALPTVTLHLEEFIVAAALLDREGAEGSPHFLFRAKATIKVVDGLILLAREQGRFVRPGGEGEYYTCGIKIVHELRTALLRTFLAASPCDTTTATTTTTTAVDVDQLSLRPACAYFLSLSYEQEALLLLQGSGAKSKEEVRLRLRAALAWWSRSLSRPAPYSTGAPPANDGSEAEPATPPSIAPFVKCIECLEEGTVAALYDDDTARCVRLIVAYTDCCGIGGGTTAVSGNQVGHAEACLALLLRLQQGDRSPNPTSPSSEDGNGLMVRAALARIILVGNITGVPAVASPGAPRQERADRLSQAEALCAGVVPPLTQLADPQQQERELPPAPSRRIGVSLPPACCTSPFALHAPPISSFHPWEARVMAHQVLADIAATRAASSALAAEKRALLSLAAITHLRMALLERRRYLGEAHEDVAASHVELGKRLFLHGVAAADRVKQPNSFLNEALGCASAAVRCLEKVIAQRFPAATAAAAAPVALDGIWEGGGIRAMAAQVPLYHAAGALKARCTQEMKW